MAPPSGPQFGLEVSTKLGAIQGPIHLAVQAICTQLGGNIDKVNVNGGAIALGHEMTHCAEERTCQALRWRRNGRCSSAASQLTCCLLQNTKPSRSVGKNCDGRLLPSGTRGPSIHI
nr:hypothetical protein [Pseudomonas sp. 9AZ]